MMAYYELKYPDDVSSWVATLGRHPGQKFDPKTGAEDFSEHRKVAHYLASWRPGEDWRPAPVCLHFRARGRKLVKKDRIFNDVVGPFISQNAVERMRNLLERQGHVLPLDVVNSDERFFLWWVPCIEDSVDYTRSEKFPNGTIKKIALDVQKVAGITAFRPHYTGMYNPSSKGMVLVDEEFKSAWNDAKLTGIDFSPV